MTDIVSMDDVMGGEPRLAGDRIGLLQIGRRVVEDGWSQEVVAEQLDVYLDAVESAVGYYRAHPAEMAEWRDRHDRTAPSRFTPSVSPLPLGP